MPTPFPWWLTRLVTDIEISVSGYWRKQQAWRDFCRMPTDEFNPVLSPDPVALLYISDKELEIYWDGLMQKRQVVHDQELNRT